jgi:methionyl-tRNA formyltransferase
MANGDQEIGISVHFIEEKIDTGKIIIQTKIDIPPCSSMHQMLVKTKMIGAEILLKSIGNISTGKFELIIPQGSGSYNSFPTKEAYIRFLSYGYTLW